MKGLLYRYGYEVGESRKRVNRGGRNLGETRVTSHRPPVHCYGFDILNSGRWPNCFLALFSGHTTTGHPHTVRHTIVSHKSYCRSQVLYHSMILRMYQYIYKPLGFFVSCIFCPGERATSNSKRQQDDEQQ